MYVARTILIIAGWLVCQSGMAQSVTDSIYHEMQVAGTDSLRLSLMGELAYLLRNRLPDSALHLSQRMLREAQGKDLKVISGRAHNLIGSIYLKKGEWDKVVFHYDRAGHYFAQIPDSMRLADVHQGLGNYYRQRGEFARALDEYIKCRDLRARLGNPRSLAYVYLNIANVYSLTNDHPAAIRQYKEALALIQQHGTPDDIALNHTNLGVSYLRIGDYDAALDHQQKALAIYRQTGSLLGACATLINLGETQSERKNFQAAEAHFQEALPLAQKINSPTFLASLYNNLGKLYNTRRQPAKAIEMLLRSLEVATPEDFTEQALEAHRLLAQAYEQKNDYRLALSHERSYQALQDTLLNRQTTAQLNELKTQYETAEKERQIHALQLDSRINQAQNRLLTIGLLAALLLGGLALAAYIQRRRSAARLAAEKQKTESLLNEKNRLYDELRQMQDRLILNEKMTSLGQLTAGIAHELNNPINFITTGMAAVSMNLDELRPLTDRLARLPGSENPAEEAAAISAEMQRLGASDSLEEIHQLMNSVQLGAERATRIVASLRTFSRDTGEAFMPVNLHESIEDALTLLHNKTRDGILIHRHLGELPLVPGQFGRLNQVFLNLLDNAIQAMGSQGELFITTYADAQYAYVRIRDTGPGMDADTQRRIFEPFFTTKEVGQGTGLGLAISYGIIKHHQGDIDVQSSPGQGATFTIKLPLQG